jgi:N-acetylneuraminic acid mutarotase
MEQLFSEYTSFVIQASNDRDMADVPFQMVQKGTKMILQYWTINGKQYPVLRTIALKVFSMAASSVALNETSSQMDSYIQNCEIH